MPRVQVVLHHATQPVSLHAVAHGLQHDAQPPVQGLQVEPKQDGRHSVPLQRLSHQQAQLVLVLSQQLQAQVGGLPDPVERGL